MNVVWILLKTSLWYFVLMYLSVNLIGIVLRCFFIRGLGVDKINNDYKVIIEFNDKKNQIFLGFIFVLIGCLFLYFLFNKFHFGFALASIIMMSTRVPDLLWEIKKNQKITKKYGPISSSLSTTLGLLLELGVAVLVCYSVYKS